MQTQMIDIKTPDGLCDSFVAYPDDKKQYPAVLLLMDAFGPREYMYDMAKTIAAQGYYVLLPNLFYRARRAPVIDAKFPLTEADMPAARTQLMALFQKYSQTEQGVPDAGVFLDFISKQKQVQPGTVGLTGYCMGGSMAVRIAERYPDRVAVAASFHAGGLASDAPDSPHRLLGRITAKLYIAHADNDQHMPPGQQQQLRDALDHSGHTDVITEVYTGAAHGFTMADLPMYNEAACKKHWQKLSELFSTSLGSRKAA